MVTRNIYVHLPGFLNARNGTPFTVNDQELRADCAGLLAFLPDQVSQFPNRMHWEVPCFPFRAAPRLIDAGLLLHKSD